MLAGTILPFAQHPYEDELLSSWIARLAVHNGKGAWRAFCRKAGLNRYKNYFRNDIPKYSAELHALLLGLGWDVETAYLQLTPAPFYLQFCAHPTARIAAGLSVPELLGGTERQVVHLHSRQASLQTLSRLLRFCPGCIADDLEHLGEAYWHRQHQLPLPAFCAKHMRALMSHCPKCGSLPTDIPSDHVPILPVRCRCGFDLRNAESQSESVSSSHQQLIRLGVESLELPVPKWSGLDVRLSLQNISRNQGNPGLLKVLEPVRKSLFESAPPGYSTRRRLLSPNRYSATSLAAVTVALGLDMQSAARLFSAQASEGGTLASEVGRRHSLADIAAMSTGELCDLLGQRNQSQSIRRRAIAILQARDPNALHTFSGFHIASMRIPTIEEDRELILKCRTNGVATRPVRLVQMARARCRIRDAAWLESLVNEARSRIGHWIFKQVDYALVRAELLRFLDQTAEQADCPKSISWSQLARAIGRSAVVVRKCFDRYPELTERLESLAASLPIRRMRWAAKQLIQERDRITFSRVIVRSGIRYTRDETIVRAAKQIADEANAAAQLIRLTPRP